MTPHIDRFFVGVGAAAAMSVLLSPAILLVIFVRHWWAWLPLALGFLYILGAIFDGPKTEDEA